MLQLSLLPTLANLTLDSIEVFTVNCARCRKSFQDDAIFCPYCGRKQANLPHKPKRAANGTGCAFQRPGQKTWTAQIVTGYRSLPPFDVNNPANKRQRVPIKKTKGGFQTKAAAMAYVRTQQQAPDLTALTLKEVYDLWDPWYSPRVDKGTFGCYRAAFAHFKPLHDRKIAELCAGDLQKCIDDCKCGHRTHQNMKVTAGLLWAYAIDHNMLEKDVTENLFIGRGASVQREPLTDVEIEKIRQLIGKHRYAEYLYALVYLGFRPGEFLEIRKDQVIEHKGRLYIVEGKKTDAGRDRTVPVHTKIDTIVRERLYIPGTDMLFPMYHFNRKKEPKLVDLRPMTSNYFNKFVFGPISEQLGIPDNKVPYSARHSFSDKLKDAEGTDKTKAALIGHSDYKFTQQKYQSTDLDELIAAVDSMD